MKHLLSALALLPLLLTSCVNHKQTQYAPVREQLLQATPDLVSPTRAPLPAQLTLAEAKRLALTDEPSLQALRSRTEAARLRYQQAYTAYYPQLAARLSGRHYEQTPATQVFGGTTFDTQSRPYKDYSGNLTLSYLLFDGYTRQYNTLATLYGIDAATAAHADAQRLIAQSVAQFFFTALLAQKRMEIAQADQNFNRSFLEDTQKRRDQGAASRADVLNFQIRHDTARITYIEAQNDYRIALLVLAELMGYPGADVDQTLTLVEPSIDTLTTPALPQAVSTALNQRPDLHRLMATLQANHALAHASKGLYYPTLTADTALTYANPQADISTDDFGLSVGLTATYNFLNAGADIYAYQEAQAIANAANHDLLDQWQRIIAQIRQELQNLQTARQKTTIQRDIVEATRTIREDVEKAYRAGQVSLTRLNEAQRDLRIADESLALDTIQILLAQENLAAATGTNIAADQQPEAATPTP